MAIRLLQRFRSFSYPGSMSRPLPHLCFMHCLNFSDSRSQGLSFLKMTARICFTPLIPMFSSDTIIFCLLNSAIEFISPPVYKTLCIWVNRPPHFKRSTWYTHLHLISPNGYQQTDLRFLLDKHATDGCGEERDRTFDRCINSALLYLLSYFTFLPRFRSESSVSPLLLIVFLFIKSTQKFASFRRKAQSRLVIETFPIALLFCPLRSMPGSNRLPPERQSGTLTK